MAKAEAGYYQRWHVKSILYQIETFHSCMNECSVIANQN